MLHEECFNDWHGAGEGKNRSSYGTRPQKIWNTYRKAEVFINARNDKALNNQGFVVSNMAEAMGFELMDLLQSTVFKTDIQSL
ncbi:hypothetical protein C3E97_027610 [Pseudomonas sp. MWU12-2115]|nr:hypothetical protein C3E97_027610 [Pseudomonas sp. MWU12-2115]